MTVRTRIAPNRITPWDIKLIEFLESDNTSHHYDTDNPRNVSGAIGCRVKLIGLEGIEVHIRGDIVEISLQPQYRASNLQKYTDWKAKRESILQATQERIVKKRKENTKAIRDEHRIMSISEITDEMVDLICFDFAESDKTFLKKEITNKLLKSAVKGRSYSSQVVALIYLLSKCPANAEKPLQFREIFNRYSKYDNHESIVALYDAIKYEKENGMQTCRLTPDMIIMSKKDELLKLTDSPSVPKPDIERIKDRFGAFSTANNVPIEKIAEIITINGSIPVKSGTITEQAMLSLIDIAIDFVKSEKVKKELMGKNPYIVAASAIYRFHNGYSVMTQEMIGAIFGCTSVSIRNTVKRLSEVALMGD